MSVVDVDWTERDPLAQFLATVQKRIVLETSIVTMIVSNRHFHRRRMGLKSVLGCDSISRGNSLLKMHREVVDKCCCMLVPTDESSTFLSMCNKSDTAFGQLIPLGQVCAWKDGRLHGSFVWLASPRCSGHDT